MKKIIVALVSISHIGMEHAYQNKKQNNTAMTYSVSISHIGMEQNIADDIVGRNCINLSYRYGTGRHQYCSVYGRRVSISHIGMEQQGFACCSLYHTSYSLSTLILNKNLKFI